MSFFTSDKEIMENAAQAIMVRTLTAKKNLKKWHS